MSQNYATGNCEWLYVVYRSSQKLNLVQIMILQIQLYGSKLSAHQTQILRPIESIWSVPKILARSCS